jgi:molybdate transport system substrate-binding protein
MRAESRKSRATGRFRTASTAVLAACLVLSATAAHAAEIRVLCSNGLRAVVEELRPAFEHSSGHTLAIQFNSTATLKQRIDGGEAFDVALLSSEAVADLVMSGKLTAGSRVELARSGIGVGFRKGAAKPDVRTTAALKEAVLRATSITYTRDGASRPQVDKMFENLGISAALQPKIKLLAAGQPAPSVAKGESEMVITLISEILPVAGVELAGPLPAEFQKYTAFSAAAAAAGANAQAVKALIAFVHGPAAAPVYAAKGMEMR